MSAGALSFTVSLFRTRGQAMGTMDRTTWGAFARGLLHRREGRKDGPLFIPATFRPECDGRVHRLGKNVTSRTAVALDCETHKTTGEIPPFLTEVCDRL